MKKKNSHFFEECRFGIGKGDRFGAAHSGARVEKVDAQVRVVTFDALADVLHRGNVERHRNAVDG